MLARSSKVSHTARPHASNRTAKGTAMNQRKMRIGMSIRGHGYHPAAWRHPDVPADGTLRVEHYARSAQTAERGKIDMISSLMAPEFARAIIRRARWLGRVGT